ncbi:unnamed protein product [Prunus armeniaca]
MHALLEAGGQGTRAPVDPQEGPSKGPASLDQPYPDIQMLPSDMMMSTDIQDADQVDQGPLNPTRLQLGLTLCHRDLRGRVTNGDARGIDSYQELTETKGYT